jgi:uncharacterized circularly permuted ATP-grasp superfamily protein
VLVLLGHRSIFKLCVNRCDFMNGYQEDMCLEEIGTTSSFYIQNMIFVLSSIVNIIEGTYISISMSMRIFTLITNKKLIL